MVAPTPTATTSSSSSGGKEGGREGERGMDDAAAMEAVLKEQSVKALVSAATTPRGTPLFLTFDDSSFPPSSSSSSTHPTSSDTKEEAEEEKDEEEGGEEAKEDDPSMAEEIKPFNLPPGERLITSYSCALLPNNLLIHGRLYVTKHYLCFGSWGSTRLVLTMEEISFVEKARKEGGREGGREGGTTVRNKYV